MDLGTALACLAIALAGSLLGGACALVPGFHVNTLSLVLLALSPAMVPMLGSVASALGSPLPPVLLFAVLLVSAAVSHSFVDFVPSTFLGAPDEGTVLSLLPAHRLLLSGQGMEAITHAASGSLLGAVLAVLMAPPLAIVLRPPSPAGEALGACVPFLLLAVVSVLVITERGHAQPIAVLDARRGSVRCGGPIRVGPALPVHGQPGALSGRVVRAGPLSFRVRAASMEWRVRWRRGRPRGFVTARGTWSVRRPVAAPRAMAVGVLLLSGLLGLAVMNSRPPPLGLFDGLGQGPLFPLLSGLFAFPALLSATSSRPVPPQAEAAEGSPSLRQAAVGTISGFLAGWMPGVTTTIGTVVGTLFVPAPKDGEEGTKSYILMLSAVGTSSVVFSLLALALEGSGRSGAMLALKEALGDELTALSSLPGVPLSALLMAVLVSSLVGYRLTLASGALLARAAAGRDLRSLNLLVLAVLVGAVLLFSGAPGLVVACVACSVGALPPSLGVRRVHLTGCLLVPLLLHYSGMEAAALDMLW